VDRRLSTVVRKALRLSPNRRYQTAADLAEALSDFLHKAGIHPQEADLAEFIRQRRTEFGQD
jgi:hypothetical protein